MKRDVSGFVTKCMVCQKVKVEHQVPSGLLQPIRIPEWKWDRITMNFEVGLPLTGTNHDSVWVVVDRIMKSAHFLPVRTYYSLDKLAELYIKEIVRLHGIPVSIISDRDLRFCDSLKPGGPLTNRQLAKDSWMLGNPTPHYRVPFFGTHD